MRLLRISPVMPFAATSYMFGLSSIDPRGYILGTPASLPSLCGNVLIDTLADTSCSDAFKRFTRAATYTILASWLVGGWSHGSERVCGCQRGGPRAAGSNRRGNRPRKHVERVRIVLASADRGSAQTVARTVGVSRPTVWRWQQRYAEAGVEGLLRDRTRKPGKAPIDGETAARLVALTCPEHAPPGDTLDRPRDGQNDGISLRSVQRI